jgi:hypothetical protein
MTFRTILQVSCGGYRQWSRTSTLDDHHLFVSQVRDRFIRLWKSTYLVSHQSACYRVSCLLPETDRDFWTPLISSHHACMRPFTIPQKSKPSKGTEFSYWYQRLGTGIIHLLSKRSLINSSVSVRPVSIETTCFDSLQCRFLSPQSTSIECFVLWNG